MEHRLARNHPAFKSFLLIRFLILIIVLDALFYSKILNLKKFFYFTLLCTSFVTIDIMIQYIFGYDLLGYKNAMLKIFLGALKRENFIRKGVPESHF